MTEDLERPFDSIEGTQEFLDLFTQAIEEAQQEVLEQIAAADEGGHSRQKDALQLVAYKLKLLLEHMAASRRTMNDLRSLRRLLLAERQHS